MEVANQQAGRELSNELDGSYQINKNKDIRWASRSVQN